MKITFKTIDILHKNTCPEFCNFANIESGMKKILHIIAVFIVCIGVANAAVRDENATNRTDSTLQNASRVASSRAVTGRTNTSVSGRTATTPVVSRTAQSNNNISSPTRTNANTSRVTARSAQTITRTTTPARAATNRPVTTNDSARTAAAPTKTVSRAATIDTVSDVITSTRTGAEYEQCKSAYFTCMDQFCQLKNDDYRRCSCSNRVFELAEIRETMQDASDQLTVFTENLDVVGMTAAQATAMKTASEGENALTSDTSASKQLLQAIMNSIRGDDASVGGKYSGLNSITLAFDTANAFGTADSGQIIASYNGRNLYDAVYPQCRAAVRADCTDAQLQRAITAYLMAVEQDCNTVQTAIENRQKEIKSAIRESSAMLDLARVENRQAHNSDDMAACLTNVENAILSEEVCGAGYHKCLDNGEFIDVSTGAPIAGVENFYELGNLLKFADGVDAADQKLSKVTSNRPFVNNFVNRVKKFAEPALDKCVEIADDVWAEYLDKAMLDIYYAQQSKVAEIKQGCFDFVSACYMNGDTSLTAAMAELTGDDAVILQPDKVTLNTEMCTDYIDSCNMMFYEQTDGENIITDYINNRQDTDTLTACRAVVKQCFDKFGGTNYENFYYPYSGLFRTGAALDWFTLYEYTNDGIPDKAKPVSKCAQQLKNISSCSSPEMMEAAFGGFDVITASRGRYNNTAVYYFNQGGEYNGTNKPKRYGLLDSDATEGIISEASDTAVTGRLLSHHVPRPTGVATEIYNQVVDILTTQCINVQGRFLELQFIKTDLYNEDNLCIAQFRNSIEYGGGESETGTYYPSLTDAYCLSDGENMCPRDYDLNVDTQSWGACLCWENGGRRSKYGKSPKCIAGAYVATNPPPQDRKCTQNESLACLPEGTVPSIDSWCLIDPSAQNQVCPLSGGEKDGVCVDANGTPLLNLPDGLGV